MRISVRQQMNDKRLAVLSQAIIWGNAYFHQKTGLAVASNGKAYTASNLHYAASLLEAVTEGRDVELGQEDARARAMAILIKILKPIAPERISKRVSRSKRGVFVPRIYGSRTARLGELRIAADVASVLVFLNQHRHRLGLTGAAAAQVKHALMGIVQTQVQASSNAKKRQRRQPVGEKLSEADLELRKCELSLPPEYHWSQSIQKLVNFGEADPRFKWPFPIVDHRCSPPLKPCVERSCLVAARGSTTPTIPTLFYKGDWKSRLGRMLPVVLVGGWDVQIIKSHPGSPGFTNENSYSIYPAAYSPSPGAGKHDYPPPLVQLEPHLSPQKDFPGLASKLREAGYDHVRFSQSHPGDEIQISVDELYGVIDKTTELYGVDKVILVGHSRGGVVARKYIVDRWTDGQTVDVEKLITYSSPHLGAQLADLGEDIIVQVSLSLLPGIGPVIESMLQLIGMIPSIGSSVKAQIQAQMIDLLAQQLPPGLDTVRAFLEAGDELKTTADFIIQLNQSYSAPVVPVGNATVPFWDAIDHVLIAGTSPTQVKLYLGSWLQNFDALSIAEELTPNVDWVSHKVWDGIYVTTPELYWLWEWTWHQVFDAYTDLSSEFDMVATAATGVPTEVLAYHPGLGDTVVEKRSALAESVKGKIRRAEFKLDHFNIKANDETQTLYQAPSGQQVSVNPWQLLFVELGLPFGQVSGCL
jgi:pimeloyl-ACP methyl ester carboxylesterase